MRLLNRHTERAINDGARGSALHDATSACFAAMLRQSTSAPVLEGLENGPAFDRLFALVPSRAEVQRALGHVRVPTLLVLGRLDFAIPHTVWEAFIAGLHHVTYVLLPEASHNPHAEAPERFDTELIAWLDANS